MSPSGAGLLGLLLILAPAALADCRLALILAIDVSSSVDETEYGLQKQGLIAALGDREVGEAFFAIPGSHVALHIFEWSGRYQQDVILGWTRVKTPADLAAIRAHLSATPRTYAEYPTALGFAAEFALDTFEAAPKCHAQTLDVSGDGVNNDGPTTRAALAARGGDVPTINGLTIGGGGDLPLHYRAEVIHGPGAFVEVATDFADFARAIRAKLIRELGVPRLGQR